jgi:hypothetical protein
MHLEGLLIEKRFKVKKIASSAARDVKKINFDSKFGE